MKFVKENLTVLICALVAVLLLVAAFVYPIPGKKKELVDEMNEELNKGKLVDTLVKNDLPLAGQPPRKGIPSKEFIAAKEKANKDIDDQKKKVEALERTLNSTRRLSANRVPLLAAPTAANSDGMVEEPNLLPKMLGDALKFKADYTNQFRIWTGWMVKGTPQDMELNAAMPPDGNELKTAFDAEQLAKAAGAPLNTAADPNAFTVYAKKQVMNKAADIRMYVDQFAFQRRAFASTDNPPTEDEIFNSFVDSWLQSDVVRSIVAVNQQASSPAEHSISRSPVKRLSRILIGNKARERMLAFSASTAGGSQNPLATPITDFGPLFLTPQNATLGLGGQTVAPILVSGGSGEADMAKNTIDYTIGMSGRSGGADYDIVMMDILLDIDPAKLNTFLDLLYQKNMGYSVSSVQQKTVDPLDRASNGYLYGEGQVVEAEIQVECLFFRSWTIPLMTDRVRVDLGVPTPKPAGP